ncbi:MAG: ABC transporter permease, partial [Actinomycetota bacterium]|nr:ABC transporter permease [Actinomycetota bacterium]
MIKRIALAVALPVVLVAAWWFTSAGSTEFYFPPLQRIIGVFPETWFGPRMVDDVLPSLARLGIGYAAALVVGIGLGM